MTELSSSRMDVHEPNMSKKVCHIEAVSKQSRYDNVGNRNFQSTVNKMFTWAWRTASASIPVSCHAFSIRALSPKTAAANAASRPKPIGIKLLTNAYKQIRSVCQTQRYKVSLEGEFIAQCLYSSILTVSDQSMSNFLAGSLNL